jgi:hypothetical protein
MKSYSFSDISFKALDEIVDISRSIDFTDYENNWFNSNIDVSKDDLKFLEKEIKDVSPFIIDGYNEQELIINFVALILKRVDFTFINHNSPNDTIRPFFHRSLTYINNRKEFTLNGSFDFAIAKGFNYPKTPYFFIQEFKQSEGTNPRPQLLAEMISAIEISQIDKIKGAFIVGQYWTFVTLHKIGEDSYRYYFSDSFNSMKISELIDIYKILLFVKSDIEKFLIK